MWSVMVVVMLWSLLLVLGLDVGGVVVYELLGGVFVIYGIWGLVKLWLFELCCGFCLIGVVVGLLLGLFVVGIGVFVMLMVFYL